MCYRQILNKPVQFCPSPVYPSLQEQLYPPSVLLQVALLWQLWEPLSHSSISKVKVKPVSKVVDKSVVFCHWLDHNIQVSDKKQHFYQLCHLLTTITPFLNMFQRCLIYTCQLTSKDYKMWNISYTWILKAKLIFCVIFQRVAVCKYREFVWGIDHLCPDINAVLFN